ncbi:hypothetical protein JCM11641_006504 [Rhodosporidiobolus odoratus]
MKAERILVACAEITRRCKAFNVRHGHPPDRQAVVAFGGWVGVLIRLADVKEQMHDRQLEEYKILADQALDLACHSLQIIVGYPDKDGNNQAVSSALEEALCDGDGVVPRTDDPNHIQSFDFEIDVRFAQYAHLSRATHFVASSGPSTAGLQVLTPPGYVLFNGVEQDILADFQDTQEGHSLASAEDLTLAAFITLCSTQVKLNRMSEPTKSSLGLSDREWRQYYAWYCETLTDKDGTGHQYYAEQRSEEIATIWEMGGPPALINSIQLTNKFRKTMLSAVGSTVLSPSGLSPVSPSLGLA